ncbi:family 16 glycosylhydrolase [Carboxylicivirga sp. N1Y90]|uniref:family 16 glycosylhydrolase n=1 Tax=Carboxylicivirga fragile TaxID=3417571 RepID=UPI003D348093|nr:family 16 glycosylhydrolase [Marinilabiliaceae bacterium N1Y90]
MKKNKLIGLVLLLSIALGQSACEKENEASTYEVAFDFSPDVTNPNDIVFENNSSGEFTHVRWDFGDGEVTDRMPASDGKTIVHNYRSEGEYDVRLTIWGSNSDLADNKSMSKKVVIDQDDPNYDPKLIWSDEFDGTSVNTSDWTLEVGTGDNGWGNNELQYYTNGDNVEVKDGKLIITAEKVDDNKERGSYKSTRMVTYKKQEFKYGRIEVRAKLPSGKGIWPAIWMLGANFESNYWPACGEMDIMEYVGYQPNVVHSTVHTSAGSGANGNGSSMSLPTCEEEFHVYGLNWSANKLVFYVDSPENVVHTYNPTNKTSENWPFNGSHFFILNVAVGGDWGGAQGIDNSIFPQTMEVDYIRVYELE